MAAGHAAIHSSHLWLHQQWLIHFWVIPMLVNPVDCCLNAGAPKVQRARGSAWHSAAISSCQKQCHMPRRSHRLVKQGGVLHPAAMLCRLRGCSSLQSHKTPDG